jgi:hypothetical protein
MPRVALSAPCRLATGLGALVLLPLVGARVLGPLVPWLGFGGAAAQAAAAARPSAPAEFPEREAFFGETHIHTSYSLDAFLGGARPDPDGAYRFARAEEVDVSGQRFRLKRPLDWAAVTDHAEDLGEMETILQSEAPGHHDPTARELRGLTTMEERETWFLDFASRNRSCKPEHLPFWQSPSSTAAA